MKLKEIVPELVVSNIVRTVEFYVEKLGFELEFTAPETPDFTWAQLKLGEFRIMLQDLQETIDEMQDFPTNLLSTMFIVLKFDNVEEAKALYKRLSNSDLSFFMLLRETDYGTVEYGIFDPDGYRIIISAE